MSQHHGGGEEDGSWVGLVLSLDIKTDVTASWLENGVLTAHVATWDETWPTNESGSNVGKDGSVQVGHHKDIELLWLANSLHGGVVDNEIVDLEGWVVLGDLVEGLTEKTISQLHDVGLVDAGNLLAVVGLCESESKLGDSLGLHLGDNLEGLDDTWNRLVLQARVFTLSVLTDEAEIDTGMSGGVAWDVLDENDGGVNVQLLTEGDVEGLMTSALNWGVEDTYERGHVSKTNQPNSITKEDSPFNPTLFLFKELTDSLKRDSGCSFPVMTPVASTCSH